MDEQLVKAMMERAIWLYLRRRLSDDIFEKYHIDRAATLVVANIDLWITELVLGGDELIRDEVAEQEQPQ